MSIVYYMTSPVTNSIFTL